MVRLGGAASPTYISVFRGLQASFSAAWHRPRLGLYSDYDALVEAFVKREIDLAWNAPLAYLKIRRRLRDPCQVVAMRDVDVQLHDAFYHPCWTRVLCTVQESQRQAGRPGESGGRWQAGLLPYYFLQQLGLDPRRDLAVCSFYDERQGNSYLDERDVVERVGRREV